MTFAHHLSCAPLTNSQMMSMTSSLKYKRSAMLFYGITATFYLFIKKRVKLLSGNKSSYTVPFNFTLVSLLTWTK